MEKSLDRKLANILKNRSCNDFILADAKDADMAYGLAAPGQSPEQYGSEAKFKTLDEYRNQIREVIDQGLVDIVLMSASTNDILALRERRFVNTAITPAIRANDATDIWLAGAEGIYPSLPSRPFRTANLDHALCGKAECTPEERKAGLGADLGLYSITFNNNPQTDYEALVAYNAFRLEAEQKGFRHFLEVFSPNACGANCPKDIPKFVNDHIVRTLAGVASAGRPVFLKIPYYGPEAMEALARYDSQLVVGILGGSAGTTYDAFKMLHDAKKYGARVALYGRKINSAEHQTTFIKYLRAIADSEIAPVEAVKAYHGDLARLKIQPKRSLEDDLSSVATSDSYNSKPAQGQKSGAGQKKSKACGSQSAATNRFGTDLPDFSSMSQAEKVQWNLERMRRSY
ncbi:MAG: hypothetical protein Q4G68_09925 [Planctomycetia bacterium]|nr:hypothetical protein [Planctomycetia bacterium]